MSIIEDSPLLVELETLAVPTRGTNAQANATHNMGAAALEGITFTRHYVTRTIEDVIKPAIKTFLETCDTNPRIAAVVATPALLGFLLVLVFFIISTLVLIMWTVLTITLGIIFVIIGGLVSLFFKLLVVVLVTIPLASIATGLLLGANRVSQSIINKMPQNGVGPAITQTVKETDWKSVVERLINLGKKLEVGSSAAWEGLLVLKTASHNSFMAFKSGVEDLHNARVENLRKDRSDPLNDSTAETSGESIQGNSNGLHQTQSVFEYTELSELQSTGSTEGIKRRVPFPQTSEGVADDVNERLSL